MEATDRKRVRAVVVILIPTALRQVVVVCVRGTVGSTTPYDVRVAIAIVGAGATIGIVTVGRRVARVVVAKQKAKVNAVDCLIFKTNSKKILF